MLEHLPILNQKPRGVSGAAKAIGLAAKMDTFDTFFGLKLAYLIFSASDQIAINIQSVDITVQEASQGA